MKKYYVTIFWFLIVFSAVTDISAQFRNTITGFVFDSQRRPVPQVPVELMNEVYQVLQRTRTDGSGRYFFSGMSSGRFIIKVMPLGTNLEEQSQELEIINIQRAGSSTSENAYKDFYLRQRRNSNDVSGVTGTVFAQETTLEARKKYERAIIILDEKKTDEGIQELIGAVKIQPNYYMALERLGIEYIKQQKYQDARDVLIKAVDVNPRSFNGWYGLGYANYGLRQSVAAIESAEKAININSNSSDATLLLGISYRQAKRFTDSEKFLLMAKKLSNGQSADVHWNLALLYAHNLKRYKDAAAELELYLKATPNAGNAEMIKKLIKQFREMS